jgi:hypothetical protein
MNANEREVSKRFISVNSRVFAVNSGHRLEDHFVDVTEMIAIGSGAERSVKTVLMSRYSCYLAIQNADPKKEILGLWENLSNPNFKPLEFEGFSKQADSKGTANERQ